MVDIPIPDLNPADAIPDIGADAPAAGAPSTVPDAPQAPADLPASAKAPEPSPDKSGSKKDDEEEEKKKQQQQDDPMDLLKPKKDEKDKSQRSAGDQMKLVEQLDSTVADINNQVNDAIKGAGNDIDKKIDQGIQEVRDYMEKDMPKMGDAKGGTRPAEPQPAMSAAADTTPPPMAAAQAGADNAAAPEPSAPPIEAPTIPDIPMPSVPGVG